MNLNYSKDINRITYNNIGLVDSILFENNAKVAYTYGLNGEKLRVAHWTNMSSAASASGSTTGGILNPSLHLELMV